MIRFFGNEVSISAESDKHDFVYKWQHFQYSFILDNTPRQRRGEKKKILHDRTIIDDRRLDSTTRSKNHQRETQSSSNLPLKVRSIEFYEVGPLGRRRSGRSQIEIVREGRRRAGVSPRWGGRLTRRPGRVRPRRGPRSARTIPLCSR